VQITNQVALVTGGASGLGLATTRRLVAAGGRVVMVDLPASKGLAIAGELGEAVAFAPADVRDSDGVGRALDVAASMGDLAIVVNCAGTGKPERVLGRGGVHSLENWDTIISVNLGGTFNVTRLAAERMAARHSDEEERGVIICTASVAAFDGQIGQVAYSASKGGIVSMTLPLARDLASLRIRMVTIAPGLFLTPLLGALSDEARDSIAAQVPHPRRLGQPEEYAALVQHIVENPMLNGETIRLDGAVRMAPR
jgi:NAD(P)-dependent dehydrogenase (short-subunit alcohol dehydrogenase family)